MKHSLLISLFFIIICSVHAQNTCTQRLNQAEDDYAAGRLLGIPERLKDCLHAEGFSKEEEKRAHKLLTLVYIFTDQESEAEKAMVNLLKADKEHQLDPQVDPAELYFLYEKFRVDPIFRIGFRIGANSSYVNVLQERSMASGEFQKFYNGKTPGKESQYAISGEEEGTSFASEAGLGLNIFGEVLFERYFGKGVEVAFGPQVRISNYNVEAHVNQSSLQITAVNRQVNLRTPLLVRYNLGYDNRGRKIIPYLFAGGSVDYLLSAGYPSFSRRGGITYTLPESDLIATGQVNRFNYSLIGGLGAKIRMKTNFLTAEVRYDNSLRPYTNGHNAYANPNVVFDGAFVEDDLSLSFISASFGFTFSVYNPKKVK